MTGSARPGTHNHRRTFLTTLELRTCVTPQAGGYGSLLSQGRQQWLVRRPPPASLRGFRGLAEDTARRREAAGGAVGDLDLILPRQAEVACDQVLHEGVGAIH